MITALHLFTIHLFFPPVFIFFKHFLKRWTSAQTPKAAVTTAKKTSHLQAKLMPCRSGEPSSARCWVCCQRMSSTVHLVARWVGKAKWTECITYESIYFSVYNIIFDFLPQGSQFSKHSSISDSSQLAFFVAPSSSDYDVCVEEAHEVVLAASGQEVVSGRRDLSAETSEPQNEGVRLLLELSSCEFRPSKTFPPCVSCPFANGDSLLQVRARTLPRSLMNP